jgi:hypothetical protein
LPVRWLRFLLILLGASSSELTVQPSESPSRARRLEAARLFYTLQLARVKATNFSLLSISCVVLIAPLGFFVTVPSPAPKADSLSIARRS